MGAFLAKVDPQLIVVALIIVFTLLGPLFERMMRRKKQERGEKVEGPEPEEPKLPYEDMVDQLFGPYVERRKREAEERRRAAEEAGEPEEAGVVEEEAPRPRPVIRRTEPLRVAEPEPAHLAPIPAGAPPETATARVKVSLDDVLFRNRRLSPGAKLVLASEIMKRPRRSR